MTKCDFPRRGVWLACSLALAAPLFVAAPANAQAEDQAAARSLFEEGRRLLKSNQYAEACPKLEAASKLYASPGILLNLADCYEKLGRTASAWTEFGEAASAADRARRPEQAKEAKRRQNALEPKLTRLTVNVSSNVPGLQIKRDETELARAVWGAALPVDPGAHEIHAEAPGREAWTTTVTVSAPGEATTVEVPELRPIPTRTTPPPAQEAAPRPVVPVTPAPAPESAPESRSHVLDWTLIGAGAAVAIAGGLVMGIEAGRASDARAETNYMQALADYNSTRTPYYIGLGGVIAGGASAAAGLLVLALWNDNPHSAALRVVPVLGSSVAGLGLREAW